MSRRPADVRRRRGRGAAGLDYLVAVMVVVCLLVALLQLRGHQPRRTPPVNPLVPLAALVAGPPTVRLSPARTTPARPRAPSTTPPRPRPPRTTVTAPGWALPR